MTVNVKLMIINPYEAYKFEIPAILHCLLVMDADTHITEITDIPMSYSRTDSQKINI
jgi:hypothetical protein